MTDFNEELSALCALHLPKARRNPALGAEMIEALARSLGMTIAITSAGDAVRISKMCSGTETYILSAASDSAPLGKFLAGAQ